MTETPFDDLLAANRAFADSFTLEGLAGRAAAGVGIVTCMDARIDPLAILGLKVGDAKVFRNPGGRVTDAAVEAMVLGAHLLGVERILVIPHTRCAMASSTEEQLHERVSASAGQDASWTEFHVVPDQSQALRQDVARLKAHPLIPESIAVGGFVYDVDSGLLEQVV